MKIAFLLTAALALPSSNFAIKDSHVVPNGWVELSDAPLDHKLDLQIGIKQENIDALISTLYKVSDPSSPDYGKHLTQQQVSDLIAPKQSTIDAVYAWLKNNGVEGGVLNANKDWLSVTVTVDQAQKMLNTKYKVYQHQESKVVAVRTPSFSLPKYVHHHIDLIQPTTKFTSIPKKIAKSPKTSAPKKLSVSSCDNGVTPQCLNDLYNIGGYTPSSSKSIVGVTGYLGQYANQADLSQFLQSYQPNAASSYSFSTVLVNGGTNPQDSGSAGTEADLDVEYVGALTYPTKHVFYSTGGSPPYIPDANESSNDNEPYLDWLNYMLAQPDGSIPQTITTSYGDDEQTVPYSYAVRVCNDFAQLGARGVSLLFSSGDGGVSGGQYGTCKSNDGKNTREFLPTFPASCPYITAVGGTTGVPETAAGLSSGGFSNYFGTPSYQSANVQSYLKTLGSTYKGLYNATGRGIPDVAAQATGFTIVNQGYETSVDGTSCASPTFAGVVSNLNDYLLGQGKPPLGFLNPWLYSKGFNGLNDITSGSNPGCNTNGFSAGKGWDPVTGLGTPNFKTLQTLV
ncbi:hypothetical protein HK103_003817 [Boothiomyces macroporosus]|uniref:tripeptidyl-peptidase II n=1 Tax=Boothiomyces macroporosus TaxID=261099 RepID=A0AAD5YB39_9FUNG|nr:hypothetical protein HK103_003817 [Boothiomyces macroporosus]